MKIKELKDKPLLDPPRPGGEVLWTRITEADEKAIVRNLNIYRSGNQRENVAAMLYLMRELGIPQEVTEKDRQLFRGLNPYGKVEGNQGLGFAARVYEIRMLGVTPDNLPYIVEERKKHLDDVRGRKQGLDIAVNHTILKELGHPQEITDFDRREMRSWLEDVRRIKSEAGVAEIHYFMRLLGLPQEITPEDKAQIRGALTRWRKTPNGYLIAHIHYLTRQLNPQEETEDKKMPPIREYRK